jgi:hypothetical protein
MNERVVNSIPAEINELVADRDLSFQDRYDLESLWTAFVALWRFVESPPEDFRLFMATLAQAPTRCDEEVERMARTLRTELNE